MNSGLYIHLANCKLKRKNNITMKLVTVATHQGGYFPYLIQSCARMGAKLNVLGWGEKWQGFTWRYMLMKHYLETLDDNEVVCFIDSFDVLLLRPLDELERFFLHFHQATGARIVVGCDKPGNSFYYFLRQWVFGTCQMKPINGGTYIGFAKDIKRMVIDILKVSSGPKDDDQVLLTNYCNARENIIHIDCDSVFFLTRLNPLGGFITRNMTFDELIIALKYDIDETSMSHIKASDIKIVMKKIWYFFPFFIGLIIVIILICICWVAFKKMTKSQCYLI